METYQREVVALIRGTGARLSILHEHRLVDLWRQYSQQVHLCGWIKADRPEVYRFVTWSNNFCGITREILESQREGTRGVNRIRSRVHLVRAWGDKPLVARRLR